MNSLGSLPDTAALYGSVVTSVIVNWRSLLKDEQEQATQLTICLASMMGSAIALYDRTITGLLCWAWPTMWWEMERFRAGAVACSRLCWAWTGQSHNWRFPNSPSHSNAPQENLIRRRDRRKITSVIVQIGIVCFSPFYSRIMTNCKCSSFKGIFAKVVALGIPQAIWSSGGLKRQRH